MNSFSKATLRFVSSITSANTLKNVIGKRDFTRTLWHMSKTPEFSGAPAEGKNSVLRMHKPSLNCSCGCGMRHNMHTKAERELVEFLTEEIVAERKAQKIKAIPSVLSGFAIKLDGADVELVKQSENEKIVISFNINHTVSNEENEEVESSATENPQKMNEMRSKPRFEIEIIRGDTTLAFACSFLEGSPQEGEYDDNFGIDEMFLYKGEWNEKVYAVSGEVLDGYLYDLLMNLLEEKGISCEFVEQLSDIATSYEHTSYIALLESLSKFTTGKKI